LEARRREQGVRWIDRYLVLAPEGRETRTERWWRVEALRMGGEVEEAVAALEELAGSGAHLVAARALRGLSMIQEHALGDREAAAERAAEGLRVLEGGEFGGEGARLEGDLCRRLERLGR